MLATLVSAGVNLLGCTGLPRGRRAQHFFCKHCGVRAFGVGNETPIGKMYGVNVGCLEGVTEEELSKVPITYVDGLNDRWQDAPAFPHL